MGKCCKCEKYDWKDEPPLVVVWVDPVDKSGYCVFHAPKEGKRDQLEKPLEPNSYNALVYERIDNARNNNERCVFLGAVFPWNIDFSRFDEKSPLPSISFMGAKFENGLSFTNATFSERADFHCMECTGVAVFNLARFHADAVFCSVVFDDAHFDSTSFFDRERRADFSGATFQASAHFVSTKFYGEADFSKVTFSANTVFQTVTFSGKADFRSIVAEDNTLYIKDMEPNDLWNVVFAYIDLRKLSFVNCWWPEFLGLEKYSDCSAKNMQMCEELYRGMKKIAIDSSDVSLVSKWNYCERFARLRHQIDDADACLVLNDVERRGKCILFRCAMAVYLSVFVLPRRTWLTLTWWYWVLSGFGECPVRAGYIFASLVTTALGIMFLTDVSQAAATFGDRFFSGLQHLLFITNPQASPFDTFWRSTLLILTRVAVPLQFTLFALALRNRFRR